MTHLSVNLVEGANSRLDHYTTLRRRIHAQPELGFEETETSAAVIEHLEALGIEVATGVGRTGVVATISRGNGGASIGLRADMDALPIQELNSFEYRSRFANRFHGCGHDGHTTILLAAAELLVRTKFNGTVHLIFQPAEEGLGGAQAMMDDGLFERFPCKRIFGMHNMPRYAPGCFAMRSGAFFAGADTFKIAIQGRGGHAAMPHLTIDPIVIAAQMISAIQTLVSRGTDPLDSAVITVGAMNAGTTHNVIPETAELRGTIRFLDTDHRDQLEQRLTEMVNNIAAAFGAQVDIDYRATFPVLVNSAAETEFAQRAATLIAGETNVVSNAPPIMGSEDFASMLNQIPGCYILIGNGGGNDACMVHNPHYDFNDSIIPIGASYWVRLVETVLAA